MILFCQMENILIPEEEEEEWTSKKVDEIKHPQQFSSSFFVEFKTHQQNREKRISEKQMEFPLLIFLFKFFFSRINYAFPKSRLKKKNEISSVNSTTKKNELLKIFLFFYFSIFLCEKQKPPKPPFNIECL
jgi:hypothetical protein